MWKRTSIESTNDGKSVVKVGDEKVLGVTKIKVEQEVGNELPLVTLECISSMLNLTLERADVKFTFKNGWILCSKMMPELEEPVLCRVKDRYGLHQEVLFRKYFEESDALYEGVYWCSYRTINVEAMGICEVIAWQELPSTELE